MTAPAALSPQEFYSFNKQKQADLIWKALFIDRSPISEACRGVITTLKALGLGEQIIDRDLDVIRTFFSRFRDEGEVGAEKFCNLVRKIAGIRYVIMTNIPFEPMESRHWRPTPKVSCTSTFLLNVILREAHEENYIGIFIDVSISSSS